MGRRRPNGDGLDPMESLRQLVSEACARGVMENGLDVRALIEERCQHEPLEKLLHRFLFCCEDKPKFALETLLKDLAWRKQVKIEQIVRRDPRELLGCDPEIALSKFLCTVYGKDRKGRPVIYYQAQSLDAKGIMDITNIERYILWQARWREIMIRRVVRENPSATAPYFTAVMDLSGVSLTQASRSFYTITKRMADLDQWHFPGVVGTMVIINSRFFFEMVWKCVRKFLSEQVESKIQIIGSGRSSILQALEKLIPTHEIPSMYGGTGPEINWGQLDKIYTEKYKTPDTITEGNSSSVAAAVDEVEALPAPPPAELESQNNKDTTAEVEMHATTKEIPRKSSPEEGPGQPPETLLPDAADFLPPHISRLVNEKSQSPRAGLRSEIFQALASIQSERDIFERHTLRERHILRAKIKDLLSQEDDTSEQAWLAPSSPRSGKQGSRVNGYVLNDLTNLEMLKNGLLARINVLEDQLRTAKEECESYTRAVKFARNYIEQEAIAREDDNIRLRQALEHARQENQVLIAAVKNSLGDREVSRIMQLAQRAK